MSTIASTGGGGSTGAGGSTGGSTGVGGSTAAAMGWGDDWRTRMAAGSTDPAGEVKQLERYESPEQVWRKTKNLEVKLSSGELKAGLPKGASPEEKARWRADNGIPAKPEDYKINMPAGKQAPKEDDAFLKAFLKNAHDSDMTQAHVDASISSYYAEVERQASAVGEAEAAAERATEDKLRQEWGTDYRVNKAMAEALLARAPSGFRDRFMNGYLADHTPIKASPEAWKWLVQLEREINPAASVMPGRTGTELGKSIADEKKELIRKSQMPKGSAEYKEYWEGDGEKRYRELLGVEEKIREKAGASA